VAYSENEFDSPDLEDFHCSKLLTIKDLVNNNFYSLPNRTLEDCKESSVNVRSDSGVRALPCPGRGPSRRRPRA